MRILLTLLILIALVLPAQAQDTVTPDLGLMLNDLKWNNSVKLNVIAYMEHKNGEWTAKYIGNKLEASDEEWAIVDAINEHRASIGSQPLEYIMLARRQSQMHNADMLSGVSGFDHSGWTERVATVSKVYPVNGAAENILYGCGWDIECIEWVWLGSEIHRINLENPDYNAIGLSYFGGYITAMFLSIQ